MTDSALNQEPVYAVLLEKRIFEPQNITPFWSLLWSWLKFIAQERAEAGVGDCRFYLNTTGRDVDPVLPAAVMDQAKRGVLAGVLGVGQDGTTHVWLAERGIPYVAHAAYSFWTVGLDPLECPRVAIEELAQQGCKRVAIWSSHAPGRPIYHLQSPEHNRYLRELFARYDLLYDESMFLPDEDLGGRFAFAGGTNQAQGYRMAIEGLTNPNRPRPDAVFSTDDLVTNGILLALTRMRLQAGVDLKIATLSIKDSPTLYGRSSELILVELDPERVAREMFALLDRLREPSPPAVVQRLIVPRAIVPVSTELDLSDEDFA